MSVFRKLPLLLPPPSLPPPASTSMPYRTGKFCGLTILAPITLTLLSLALSASPVTAITPLPISMTPHRSLERFPLALLRPLPRPPALLPPVRPLFSPRPRRPFSTLPPLPIRPVPPFRALLLILPPPLSPPPLPSPPPLIPLPPPPHSLHSFPLLFSHDSSSSSFCPAPPSRPTSPPGQTPSPSSLPSGRGQ